MQPGPEQLREVRELLDDAGTQIVLHVVEEPHPATRRLMALLGVPIEVGPGGLTVQRGDKMTTSVAHGETGKPRWRTGEKQGRRSDNERDVFGALTMGELVRREQASLDETPTRALCGFCDWTFAGSAAEAREAGAAHRAEKHPDRVFIPKSRKPVRAASYRTLDLDTVTDQPEPDPDLSDDDSRPRLA